MNKIKFIKKALLIITIILVVIFAVFYFSRIKPSEKESPVATERKSLIAEPESVSKPQVIETPIGTEAPPKKLIIDLENLGIIKELDSKKQNFNSLDIINKYLQPVPPKKKTFFDTPGAPFTIYEKGKIKIKGGMKLNQPLDPNDTLEDLKDKTEVQGGVAAEF